MNDPRAIFLKQWDESGRPVTVDPITEPAPLPAVPALESDTASGDVRVAIVKLTERSHETAAAIREIKVAIDRMQRSVSQLVVRQAAEDAGGAQIQAQFARLDQDMRTDRDAIGALQRWRIGVRASTAAWVSAGTAIGAVVVFVVEHMHL